MNQFWVRTVLLTGITKTLGLPGLETQEGEEKPIVALAK